MKDNPSDKVYTPPHIVDEVLSEFSQDILPGSSILEPFRGGGAFYDKFPDSCTKQYCELDEGIDFFSYEGFVDWIITNPPYSIFKDILPRCLELADNVILLIPSNKLLSSMPRMMDIINAGHNIKRLHYVGSGRQIGFPFGFPVAAIHIQRGYRGDIKLTYAARCGKTKECINNV